MLDVPDAAARSGAHAGAVRLTPPSETDRMARGATNSGASKRSIILLTLATVIGLIHHTDHVLRADHSGWPFTPEFTPFAPSLLAYVFLFAAYVFRARPRISAILVGIVLVGVIYAHVFIETPYQQYDVWATGVSHLAHSMGKPNLLHLTSPALGVAAVVLSITLSLMLLAASVSFWADARRAPAVGRGSN